MTLNLANLHPKNESPAPITTTTTSTTPRCACSRRFSSWAARAGPEHARDLQRDRADVLRPDHQDRRQHRAAGQLEPGQRHPALGLGLQPDVPALADDAQPAVGQTVQYKYINFNPDGSYKWEADPNHVIQVPATATTRFDAWQTNAPGSPASPYTCPGQPQVSVMFNELVNTTVGQTVRIVGSIPALGTWNPQSAIPLTFAGNSSSCNNRWTVTLSFPAGQAFQYKYIVFNADGTYTWEGDPNHVYTVPVACTSSVAKWDVWQNSSAPVAALHDGRRGRHLQRARRHGCRPEHPPRRQHRRPRQLETPGRHPPQRLPVQLDLPALVRHSHPARRPDDPVQVHRLQQRRLLPLGVGSEPLLHRAQRLHHHRHAMGHLAGLKRRNGVSSAAQFSGRRVKV